MRRVLRDVLIATVGAALGSWIVATIRDQLEIRAAWKLNAEILRSWRKVHETLNPERSAQRDGTAEPT